MKIIVRDKTFGDPEALRHQNFLQVSYIALTIVCEISTKIYRYVSQL